jgi:acetyl-CoA carboxylase biotin carboxyl carrier protein
VATGADPGRASLLDLVDRLALFLDQSELAELEIEAGGTALLLRKPMAGGFGAADGSAADAAMGISGAGATAGPPGTTGSIGSDLAPPAEPPKASVKAPLTGIFYSSPSPGSAPYVQVGGEIAVGQVIGLIEAMKLFNEIKSDLAGRVTRLVAETGSLVKAKQPLVEVEPL